MKLESCKGCPYYDRPGPIWGTGNRDKARIAFVGVNPPEGGVARVLDNACRRAQINREREFSTGLVKCQLKPGEQPHWKAVQHCAPLLQQELLGLRNLKVVATLGEEPFKQLTGKNVKMVIDRPKSKVGLKPRDMHPELWLRGCPFPIGNRKVIIPLMSPQFYMKTGFVTAYQFDMDIQKVATFANGQGRFYEQKANYTPSATDVEQYLEQIVAQGYGGIDIETPEELVDEDELRAGSKVVPIEIIGVSCAPGDALGIRPEHFPLLKRRMCDGRRRTKWYVFNEAFDFFHLGKLFGSLAGVIGWDVMLGMNRWRSDLLKKDLAMALSFFTHLPYTKNLSRTDPIRYQWADTCGVLEAGLTLERTLEAQNLLKTVVGQDFELNMDLYNPSLDGLNKMREIGIRADMKEVFRFMRVSEAYLEKYTAAWARMFPLVDWQSPQQLFTLFTKGFKLPVIMRKRVKKKDGERLITKTPTCDVKALEEYRDKYGNKTAGMILAMREIKHLGDFAGIVSPDQRIHTTYLIHRQVQFRLQAVEPNIQQLPEELGDYKTRRMVIPDNPEEDAIITIDASQCELRIYAYVSKAKRLLEVMNSDTYIYGFMYEQIFKKPFFKPNLPKTKYNKQDYVRPQEILAAKSGPLGFIYDRGWQSLVDKNGMDPTAAKESHAGFHRENPEIREFHRKCDAEVLRLGYQTNLWGGRRYFPTPKVQRNEYLSFHGQSNMGELLRSHYLKPAFRHLPDFGGSRVLLTVHDSMAVNVKRGKVDLQRLRDVAQFLYDHAQAPIEQMEGMVIPAEVKWSPTNWADTKMFDTHKDERGRTVVKDVKG